MSELCSDPKKISKINNVDTNPMSCFLMTPIPQPIFRPDDFSEIERRNFVADIDDFREATGWRPKVDLAEGIKKTIASFLVEGAA